MIRKGLVILALFTAIVVLNNCAYNSVYRGKPLDADIISGDTENGPVDISSGKYFINVNGMKRDFIVTMPESYDKAKSYPLIFAWHGFGGSAIGVAVGAGSTIRPYYGLLRASENQAIFIAGQGLPTFIPGMGSNYGWDNRNGRDIAFVNTLINWAKLNLSIDESRVFCIGFSYGAMFSNLLACKLGNKIRAIASIAGSLFDIGIGNPQIQCKGENVATWLAHAPNDLVVPYSKGEAVYHYFIDINECGNSYTKIKPDGCVRINDCIIGYPVVWCVHKGGHTVPLYVGREAWDFFSQF